MYESDQETNFSNVVFPVVNRGPDIAMPKHAPSNKWQSDMLAKENSSNLGGDVGECISHTANHKVLKY